MAPPDVMYGAQGFISRHLYVAQSQDKTLFSFQLTCILYCNARQQTVLFYTILYCTALYHAILYYTELYHAISYHAILHVSRLYTTNIYSRRGLLQCESLSVIVAVICSCVVTVVVVVGIFPPLASFSLFILLLLLLFLCTLSLIHSLFSPAPPESCSLLQWRSPAAYVQPAVLSRTLSLS